MRIKLGKRKHSLPVIIRKYLLGVLYAKITILCLTITAAPKNNLIVLTGHRLDGNLKAFAEWLIYNQDKYSIAFFADDPKYFKRIKKEGSIVPVYSMHNILHLCKAARAAVICSSHGPSFFASWKNSVKKPIFVEAWHGVGFKSRPEKEVNPVKFYDGVLVSSKHFKKLHLEWGYEEEQLFVTGYARVDQYTNLDLSLKERGEILKSFDLEETAKKIVLFAPTWRVLDNGSIFPFDLSGEDFIKQLNTFAEKNDCLVVVRPHLNTDLKIQAYKERIFNLPASTYPDTNELLKIIDVLVTDWSSIFTDFLPLKRPVVFINSEPTFNGFALNPSDRSGDITVSMDSLIASLEEAVNSPVQYMDRHCDKIKAVTKLAWGDTLDGKSSKRYYNIISEILKNEAKNR